MRFFANNRVPLALMTLMAFLTFSFLLTFAETAEASRLGALNRKVEQTPPVKDTDADKSPQTQKEKKGFFQGLLDGITNLANGIMNFMNPVLQLAQAGLMVWGLWKGLSYLWGKATPFLERIGLKKPTPVIQPMSEVIQDPERRMAHLITLNENRKIEGAGLNVNDPNGVYRITLDDGSVKYVTAQEACNRYNFSDICSRFQDDTNRVATVGEHHVQFSAVTQNLTYRRDNTLTYKYEVSDFVGGVVRQTGTKVVTVDWDLIEREGLFGCNVPLPFSALEYEYKGQTLTIPGVIHVMRVGSMATGVGQQESTDCVEWISAASSNTTSFGNGGPTGNSDEVGGDKTPPTSGIGPRDEDEGEGDNSIATEFKVQIEGRNQGTKEQESGTPPNGESGDFGESQAGSGVGTVTTTSADSGRDMERTTLHWPNKVPLGQATLQLRVPLGDRGMFRADLEGWAYEVPRTPDGVGGSLVDIIKAAGSNALTPDVVYLNIELGTLPLEMLREWLVFRELEPGTIIFVPDRSKIPSDVWSNIQHLRSSMYNQTLVQ